MTKPSLRLLPLLSLFVAVAGCAASSSEETGGDDPASADSAVNAAQKACSASAYDAAFAKYKSAVEHAKARNRGAVCDDGTTLWEISGELRAATTSCGKFQSIIETSQWAQPVRDALKGNIALAMLTGKVDGELKGLNAALPGTTIFGPAPGVYGNMSKLSFKPNGAATLSRLHVSDEGQATWTDIPAKWSISAPKKLSIEAEGKTTVYDVKIEDGELHFVPTTAGDDFRSMPSECEA
jgi:hypothetical protein